MKWAQMLLKVSTQLNNKYFILFVFVISILSLCISGWLIKESFDYWYFDIASIYLFAFGVWGIVWSYLNSIERIK